MTRKTRLSRIEDLEPLRVEPNFEFLFEDGEVFRASEHQLLVLNSGRQSFFIDADSMARVVSCCAEAQKLSSAIVSVRHLRRSKVPRDEDIPRPCLPLVRYQRIAQFELATTETLALTQMLDVMPSYSEWCILLHAGGVGVDLGNIGNRHTLFEPLIHAIDSIEVVIWYDTDSGSLILFCRSGRCGKQLMRELASKGIFVP